MEGQISTLDLHLATPFRVSHGRSEVRRNVLFSVDGSFGEAAIVPYYPFGREEVIAFLEEVDVDALTGGVTTFALEDALLRIPDGPPPGRAAVDMALHDLWARDVRQPLFRLFGLDPERCPPSSVTIGIPESDDDLRDRIVAWTGWPLVKLKLGTGDMDRDEEIARIVQEETNAAICVDANGGWSVPEAAEIIPRINSERLLFVEQPVPREDPSDWIRLKAMLPSDAPPLIADESIQSMRDIITLADCVDGINIKLAKAGGIGPARQMMAMARALDLRILLGCMVESSLAVTAAAHLAPMADFVDLDGPVLISNDPFRGIGIERGRISLPREPGLGVRRTGSERI